MKQATTLLSVLVLVLFHVNAIRLQCDKRFAREYTFLTEVDGMGGEQASAQGNKQKTVIQASIVLECHSLIQFKSKRTGMVNRLIVKNVQITDTISQQVNVLVQHFFARLIF